MAASFGLCVACQHDVRDDAASLGGGGSGQPTTTDPAGEDATSTAMPATSASTSGLGDDDQATSGPGDADDTGEGPKLDVASGMPNGPGCAKIDFLFVVDNSGSMEDEQENLAASFPGFFATIQEQVSATDFHLMVVTTDGSLIVADGTGSQMITSCSAGNCVCYPGPDCCESACTFPNAETCFGVPCDQALEVEVCDIVEGAGRRFGSGQACAFASGGRYMTGSDANVEAAFACASDVGTFGSGNEIPMDAMLGATSPELNNLGGCNEGFVRDDAVLVVTFITDEEDQASMRWGSEPGGWYTQLMAHKGNLDNAVVVLGLVGDNDEPAGVCSPYDPNTGDGAQAAPKLIEFVEHFGDHGFVGSVCAADYGPFFEDAVAIIDTTCDDFDPEG